MTGLVKQEIIFYGGEVTGLTGQFFERRDSLSGALAGLRDEPLKVTDPGALLRHRLRAHAMFDGLQTGQVKSCQFTQRRDHIDIATFTEPIL